MIAMAQQPEFSFMKDYLITRRRRKPSRGVSRKSTEIQRQALRSKCAREIIRIVEAVADSRQIDWKPIFDKERGNNVMASARVLAMGLCCAMEVPQYMVARAFKRSWATVFCAENRCSKLYRDKPEFRKEWDRLMEHCSPTPKS